MQRLRSANGLVPKPFLKWAGGKTQLLGQLESLFPRKFNSYHEPFLGSAAVFFHLSALARRGQLDSSMAKARLTDSSVELVKCYWAVRDDAEAVIKLLARHKAKHSREHYYRVRAQSAAALSNAERAARLIYLNKTCYNGLYRVNRKGQFNVPMGSYTNPRIFNANALRLASEYLRGAEVAIADFRQIVQHAARGDFVYFDPPYHPLNATSSFTAYTENTFGEQQQRELAAVFGELDRRGCKVMLSNSWTPFILELYRGHTLVPVKASRAINSKPGARGKIKEVVVLNYNPNADR